MNSTCHGSFTHSFQISASGVVNQKPEQSYVTTTTTYVSTHQTAKRRLKPGYNSHTLNKTRV